MEGKKPEAREEKKPEIETKISYDDRRKELTQVLIQKQDAKIKGEKVGKLVIRRTAVYDEAGIRAVLKDLEEQKKVYEGNVEKLGELQESPEMTPELQELKDKLVTLQKINHAENVKEEDSKKEKENLKQSEEGLKEIKRDIKDIRDTIGSRLKL